MIRFRFPFRWGGPITIPAAPGRAAIGDQLAFAVAIADQPAFAVAISDSL